MRYSNNQLLPTAVIQVTLRCFAVGVLIPKWKWPRNGTQSISGLVAEYIVAIDVTPESIPG